MTQTKQQKQQQEEEVMRSVVRGIRPLLIMVGAVYLVGQFIRSNNGFVSKEEVDKFKGISKDIVESTIDSV